MDRIGDILNAACHSTPPKPAYICEICGRNFEYTSTLTLPSSGIYGSIYDDENERCLYVCEDCIDALQEVINARYQQRGENDDGC